MHYKNGREAKAGDVVVIAGKGHEGGAGGQPFFQSRELVDFLIKQALATVGRKAPATEKSEQPGAK